MNKLNISLSLLNLKMSFSTRKSHVNLKPDPVVITTDSDEEEKAIKQEIGCIRREFEEVEIRLRRLRHRLKRNYERLEKIQIRRMVTQREREIRDELFKKWLPRLKYNQRRLIRMEQDVLNSVSAPIQLEDKRFHDHGFKMEEEEDDEDILKFNANEILASLCNKRKSPLNQINPTTQQ